VVFEAEPEAAGLMSRPPRPVGNSPFSRANALRGSLQGAGLAVLLLAGHALLRQGGLDEAQARTAVFVALVLDVLLLTLANRQPPATLRTGDRRSPWVARMTLAIVVLLIAVLALEPLRALMGLAVPDAALSGAVLVLAGLAAAWLGILRRAYRGRPVALPA
jgi:Ca2+-transporting ATPase